MQLRQLIDEENGVSPVIGIILMIAITVTLAAVVASFVLGVGGQQTEKPTASFSFEYQAHHDNNYGNVTITHEGGDTITANELTVRGAGIKSSKKADFDGDDSDKEPSEFAITSSDTKWSDATGTAGVATGNKGGESAVVGGDYVRVWVNDDYDISVVYQSAEGDESTALGSHKGPAKE